MNVDVKTWPQTSTVRLYIWSLHNASCGRTVLQSIDAAVGGEIGISVLLWWISCSRIVEHAGGGKEWNNSHPLVSCQGESLKSDVFYWVFVDRFDFRLLSFTSGNCMIQKKNEVNAKIAVRYFLTTTALSSHNWIMNKRMLKDKTQPDPQRAKIVRVELRVPDFL